MASETNDRFVLQSRAGIWIADFTAMAGPCEVHICSSTESEAGQLASLALAETRRIENKYSRYREGNIVHRINNAGGEAVAIDEETARLVQFAHDGYHLSDRLFDVTSGVLRKAWTFDGGEAAPDEALIIELRKRVGWGKVEWNDTAMRLPDGMEIDFGGLGKEYAVDRVTQLLQAETASPLMVNFGGDLRAVSPTGNPRVWAIGIEDPLREERAVGQFDLTNGAIATSGDSRRYCTYKGQRFGHILNPTTGWPVSDAPRSVTVVGATCIEAGFLATLAILQGPGAEAFLEAQGVTSHCIR